MRRILAAWQGFKLGPQLTTIVVQLPQGVVCNVGALLKYFY